VRINDISVSRCHAIIKCKKDGFYIEDNLSKFGTIVLLKDKMRLAEDHTMAVQVGRSVVSFTIKNIDVREKLKREIAPLLNRTRKEKAEQQKLQMAAGDRGVSLDRQGSHDNDELGLLNEVAVPDANAIDREPEGRQGGHREVGKSVGASLRSGGATNMAGKNANYNIFLETMNVFL